MRTRWWLVALAGIGLIALLVGALGIWQAQRADETARRTDALRLDAARREIEANIVADLALRAGWLAGDAATTAYVADALASGTPDVASISDLLGERRTQLEVDTVGLIDRSGAWVAGTRPWLDSGGKPAGHRLFLSARAAGKPSSGLVREDSRLFLVTLAPMLRAGGVIAYAYAGRELDTTLLERLAKLVPADTALVEDAMRPRVWAASGEHEQDEWLAALAPGARPVWTAPLFADTEGAQWLALATDARSQPDWLPLLTAGLALAMAWLAFCAAGWGRLLVPVYTALGLLERAASGDFHLRAPAWPGGMRGRFAAAFDVLMQRIGAR